MADMVGKTMGGNGEKANKILLWFLSFEELEL